MAKKTKQFLNLFGICLGLFLVIDLVAGALSQDKLAYDTAKTYCREKGWQDSDLALSKSNVSGWLLGQTATVELTTKNRGQPKTIRVRLRRPINLLEWQVLEYHEELTELKGS